MNQFQETFYDNESWVLIKMPHSFYNFMTDILSAYQTSIMDKIQEAMRNKSNLPKSDFNSVKDLKYWIK